MAETCPTVKIVSDVEETGGYIVINEADFDAEIHEIYVEPPVEEAVEKVKIKTDKNQRGWTEIAITEFDAEKHELYEEPEA